MKRFILSSVMVIFFWSKATSLELVPLIEGEKYEKCKRVYTLKTDKLLFKNKLKVLAETGVIGLFVFAFRYELISKAIPSLKKGSGSLFALDNPANGILLNVGNFFLENAQMMMAGYCMNMMYQRLSEFIKPGRWKFTLINFLRAHTQLYESFEVIAGEVKGLLYQHDKEVQQLLIKNIEMKLIKLIGELYYVDGYILLKIKKYNVEERFNAKTQLEKEYKAFEVIRRTLILQLIKALEECENKATEEEMYTQVLQLLYTLQVSSQQLQQRLVSLNLYN